MNLSIEQFAADLQETLNQNAFLKSELQRIERIMLAAVLSNGGKLTIDPKKFTEATLNEKSLEFSFGLVTFEGSEFSISRP